jgi:hypothetical protein
LIINFISFVQAFPDSFKKSAVQVCNPGTTIGLFLQTIIMEPEQSKKIESPAWQNPAPGNEQNDSVKTPTNPTIKTGGNSRSAEDDLDLEKQPYHDLEYNGDDLKEDFNEDPDEQSIKK